MSRKRKSPSAEERSSFATAWSDYALAMSEFDACVRRRVMDTAGKDESNKLMLMRARSYVYVAMHYLQNLWSDSAALSEAETEAEHDVEDTPAYTFLAENLQQALSEAIVEYCRHPEVDMSTHLDKSMHWITLDDCDYSLLKLIIDKQVTSAYAEGAELPQSTAEMLPPETKPGTVLKLPGAIRAALLYVRDKVC